MGEVEVTRGLRSLALPGTKFANLGWRSANPAAAGPDRLYSVHGYFMEEQDRVAPAQWQC